MNGDRNVPWSAEARGSAPLGPKNSTRSSQVSILDRLPVTRDDNPASLPSCPPMTGGNKWWQNVLWIFVVFLRHLGRHCKQLAMASHVRRAPNVCGSLTSTSSGALGIRICARCWEALGRTGRFCAHFPLSVTAAGISTFLNTSPCSSTLCRIVRKRSNMSSIWIHRLYCQWTAYCDYVQFRTCWLGSIF